ncbi:hypothetical protein F0562_024433 [Nyssa sinensis]|uniref:Sacsin/Nov domain-containing protein n=1 Tax=Nyssa sinensis TaxID=561372 RepID=A0A5J5BFZ9_9ASTE|nr:hypothetical protein F0562_024433 [Nyssa sinensis]
MATPREHIEEIRRKKFFIGLDEENPLAPDLYQAVNYLSAELYTKDSHFLMEIIQNAEDNEYLEGVEPSLEFVITSRDITATGAEATLLVFNNERGFSAKNIESICSVGRSTKKGNRKRGYIGEKGIGFKSVFLITAQPYIFSNGYQIRFNEEPCTHCNLGYIVPEWVDENPSLSVIKQIYGSGNTLPTTTIVLPLKYDKVSPVKQQLSSIHPEVLLFLSKIKRLSVKEDNEDPRLNTVNSISISSEINFVTRKNIDAESYLLHLSADKACGGSERECGYHMWRQRFPVRQENKVDRRMEVEEWVITLAFPFGQRLRRETNSPGPGVYAFLPTEMVTNFPFIIQADFLLASSRETILLDNKWNQGILNCVPSAFINAFISLVKSTEGAPVSSLPPMFGFLPVNSSSYPQLNAVRETIKATLVGENIVPCESYMEQKFFHKPCEVGRLMPAFWRILDKARKQGVSLQNISSHGRYVLSSSFDKEEYNHILNFLGVEPVDDEWYAKCIRSSNLVLGVSEDVYLELLLFLAENWSSRFQKTNIKKIPLLKEVDYLCGIMPLVDNYGRVTTVRRGVLVPANGSKWVELIGSNPWRGEGYVELGEDYLHSGNFAGVFTPAKELIKFLKNHLNASDIPNLSPPNAVIPTMSAPLTKQNTFLLLDWIRNLKQQRVEMPSKFLTCIKEGNWLRISLNGSPGYRPPSQSFLSSSSWGSLLQNGSVLVDIPIIDQGFYGFEINGYEEELRTIGVMFGYGEACEFIGNHLIIKDGRWLRTSRGDKRPAESVLFDQEWRAAKKISDIPFIDQDYYGEEILCFKTELQLLGVIVGFNQKYEIVADYLKSSTCFTSLNAEVVLFILECIRHLTSSDKLVRTLKDQKFLKTNMGYMSPLESYLFDPEWGCLMRVFNSFALVDQNFYQGRILSYKYELKKLGVKVDFEEAAKEKLKDTDFKFPSELKHCIREVKWLRTRLGDYRLPRECILFGPDWESISQISLLPFIDDSDKYYSKGIYEYKEELISLGVVAKFKVGSNFVISGIYLPQNLSSITPANLYSLLECIRNIQQEQNAPIPDDFRIKVDKKWLKTNAGFRPPNKCLLFDSNWDFSLQREDGPFIDEEFYGSNIKSYKKELSALGVIVDEKNGCPLLASHLDFHSNFATIVRIYNYLNKFNWVPDNGDTRNIWIPDGSYNGKWVRPRECVLHDKHDLFGMQLNVLEKHYEKKLLSFFSNAFEVKSNPSVDDYCKLWRHRSSETLKILAEKLLKLPVCSGPDEILLSDKCDVFIADDLQLKDLFEQSSSQPLFVWYPQPSSPSLLRTELLEIYSESEGIFNWEKGCFRLILGFLADPSLQMEAAKRHEAVSRLLNLIVLETLEPITMEYSLSTSSGDNLNVKASRMIRWERENSKFFTQKLDRSGGHKSIFEYATYFSEVISEGVLWEKEDHIRQLAELIRLGFLVEFNEEAIGFLLKTKNLQIYLEDEGFLSFAFPSV